MEVHRGAPWHAFIRLGREANRSGSQALRCSHSQFGNWWARGSVNTMCDCYGTYLAIADAELYFTSGRQG